MNINYRKPENRKGFKLSIGAVLALIGAVLVFSTNFHIEKFSNKESIFAYGIIVFLAGAVMYFNGD